MPTFCRHNRFLERCPICSKTLPDPAPTGGGRARATRRGQGAAAGARGTTGSRSPGQRSRRAGGGDQLRVHRETRAADDGYRNPLVPGLRASSDAARLAQELAFANGRLSRLQDAAPDVLGQARALAQRGELERATWACFLTVYLSPLQGEDPFAGIRLALSRGESPSLQGVPLGPRTSHDPARGAETLLAYRQWTDRGGRLRSGAAGAFLGEESWTPQRRFARLFERLAFPGFGRMGRYELLVTLGALGVYELRADSLHLSGERPGAPEDLTTGAAKRIFGIAEPVHLERRTVAFAQASSLPIEALDLALANWSAGERATLGFPADVADPTAEELARDALGV